MPNLRLLLLSAGTQVGQNVVAALVGRRQGVTLIATSSVDHEPALFDFDVVYTVPQTATAPEDFERRLLDVIDRERVDLVIPCRDDDVLFLGSLRDRRPDLAARLLCGGAAAARAINDKWLSHEFSRAHGLPFAPSTIQCSVRDRAAFVRRYGFPLVAKPRGGWASMEIYLVNTDAQLARMLAREDFVVQQFLGDPQAMADYLARLEFDGVPLFHDFQGPKHSMQALIAPNGSITDVFSMHLVRQLRRSKWVRPDCDPVSLDIAERCARAFSAAGWRGPINIQCRKTVGGEIRIHEFSGRFTGATVDRWLLGFDEVGAAIERFTGVRLESTRAPVPKPLEAFESRVGRAADPRHVAALARDGVCRRVVRSNGIVHLAVDVDVASSASTINGQGGGKSDSMTLMELAAMVGLDPVGEALTPPGARETIGALTGEGPERRGVALTKRERRVTGDPLVSVLIPAYNPRFFAACLDSALSQTYHNVEIVICDDSPGPEIEQIVQSRASGGRVRYHRNEVRLRPRANFVRCFERARGEFVKFLCDDDVLAPACIARLLDAFRRAPDVALATSHRLRIDERGMRLGEQPATAPIVADSSILAGYTLANAMLMAGLNTIGEPSTTLFRKADFPDAGRGYFHFNGATGRGIIDMVMWTVLLLKGNAVYLRESLSSFRIHPGQRQRDPVTQRRSIDSIRGLQAAWLALKFHERQAPDLLLAKPFPPDDSVWRTKPVLGFAARRV